MASLKFREKKILEDFLEMNTGYVLDFSNRTFSEFFRDFGIDIDGPAYLEGHSGSKANRIRSFWDRESDQLVGSVIEELVNYAESYRPNHPTTADCRAIAQRLSTQSTPVTLPNTLKSRQKQSLVKPKQQKPPKHSYGSPIEIFFSYAHEDEELMDAIRLQLVVHERLGEIVKWHDRMIPAGDEWRNKIDERIEQAHVILLFMSPHFLASRYCYEVEGEIALRRHQKGTAKVIPVVLRACNWTVTPFGELQALPNDGIPINQWPDLDQVTLDVARRILESIS